jgi:putative transposase
MARALRVEFEGALYHVCARGNKRERIFTGEKDYLLFVQLLGQSAERFAIEVHAYVLLPNHFHLLVRTRRANLGRWMHWLLVSYSVSFNLRHRSSGHLFQGRYKSFLVGGGKYVLGLSRYIHLNPVRGRVLGAGDPRQRRERLRAYRWSSYRGYAALANPEDFVSEELVLGEFDGRARVKVREQKVAYRGFVEEGLLREIENPFEAVQWQMVLGSESFAQKLKDKLGSARSREVSGWGGAGSDAEALITRAAKRYQIPLKQMLAKPPYGSEAHNVAMWLLWQKGGLTLREIGALFGKIDYVAVSQRIRRIERRLAKERKLRQTCQMLNVKIRP